MTTNFPIAYCLNTSNRWLAYRLAYVLSIALMALYVLCDMSLANASDLTLQPLLTAVQDTHNLRIHGRGLDDTAATGAPAIVQPQIHAFNVDEVKRLQAGVELNFGIYGTPGGQASLRINGATRNVDLTEVEPGQYEGVYVISARDTIAARSAVTANLRVGNLVTSAVLSESLVIGVGRHPLNDASALSLNISEFQVAPVYDLRGGQELRFTLHATPGSQVELSIHGVRGRVLLTEGTPGDYSVAYVIRSRDQIQVNSDVIAYASLGDKVISQRLAMPLVVSDNNRADNNRAAPRPLICHNCGRIEAINVIETRGEGGYLGTIGGGLVGALLGSQVGGGNGRTAAQVAGAIGGAYAGRAIEGNSRKAVHYEVVVRLQNSARQVFSFGNPPEMQVGQNVRIDNGRLVLLP